MAQHYFRDVKKYDGTGSKASLEAFTDSVDLAVAVGKLTDEIGYLLAKNNLEKSARAVLDANPEIKKWTELKAKLKAEFTTSYAEDVARSKFEKRQKQPTEKHMDYFWEMKALAVDAGMTVDKEIAKGIIKGLPINTATRAMEAENDTVARMQKFLQVQDDAIEFLGLDSSSTMAIYNNNGRRRRQKT